MTESRDGNTMTLVGVDPYPVAALAALFDDGLPEAGPAICCPRTGIWWRAPCCRRPGAARLDGHPRSGLVTAPPGLPRRMFAGGRLSALGTVTVGERLERTQHVTASTDKQGRSGPLRFSSAKSVFRRPDGDVVLVEEQDIVYRAAGAASARGASPDAGDGRRARSPTRPGEPLRAVFRADAVALQRFSAATANPHRIHYDHPYVTAVEGYPGLIVHGPLLLLSMLELVRLDLPDLVVTQVRFRAQAPVFAGDTVDLAGERHPDGVVRLSASGAVAGPDAPDAMTVECVARPRYRRRAIRLHYQLGDVRDAWPGVTIERWSARSPPRRTRPRRYDADEPDPGTRSAAAGLRQLRPAGTGRRTPGGTGSYPRAAAGAGDVRAGRPAASGQERVPRLPGPEPVLCGHLLAELRLGVTRGGDVGTGR